MTEQPKASAEPVFDEASDGDRFDQELVAIPTPEDQDDLGSLQMPLEASEGDAIEQHQSLPPEPDEL